MKSDGNDKDATTEAMAVKRDTRRISNPLYRASDIELGKDEAAEPLMQMNGDFREQALAALLDRPKEGKATHQLWNPWLRPSILSVIGAVLVLMMIIIASHTVLFPTNPFLPSEAGPLSGPGNGTHGMLGIELHPEKHVLREARTITHHWNVTSGFRTPDGVKKEVYLINGEFPGPTLECRSGDKIVIHVTNSLPSEGVSIHWHGLYMRGTNVMDGAVGFTQCPIPTGELFTYEFDVDDEQSGTFWWHAHSQVQRGDGLYGGLVVHKPKTKVLENDTYGYDKEVLLLIGDWYHRSAEDVLAWYTGIRAFVDEPVPDSMVINGAGRFNCSMAHPATPLECSDLPEETSGLLGAFATKTSTRLRVVNVGTLAGFTLQVTSATLVPLMVDGGFAISSPAVDSVGILYPGERVDMLLQWNKKSSPVPRLLVSLDPENFNYPNSALNPNQSFPVFFDSPSNIHIDDEQKSLPSFFDLATATASPLSKPYNPILPAAAEQAILLYTKTQKLSINSNSAQGFINRTSWSLQSNPPLPLLSLPRSKWDTNQFIPYIPKNKWVDLIINNLDDGAHPFHLHGHDFYVLASHRSEHGWGSYSPYATKGSASFKPELNLRNPVRKDTVSVPRRGYVVIRFRAGNEGVWMFHCHVLFHQASGMVMGFAVGGDEGHEGVDVKAGELCGIRTG